MNVAAWADAELERNGDYDGLICDGRAWSSRTLHEHAARFAQALRALGVVDGDRVVVVLPNSPELVVAFPATTPSARSACAKRAACSCRVRLDHARPSQIKPS